MNMFEVDGDRIIPSPTLLAIKEFKSLPTKDRDDVLAYIFNLVDYRSPYAKLDDSIREQVVNQDIPIKITKGVQAAIDKYRELTTTEAVLMLNSARKAVRELRTYFEELDITEADDPGRASKDLIANIKALGGVIQGLRELEEEVTKQKETTKNIRKSVEINEFNEG